MAPAVANLFFVAATAACQLVRLEFVRRGRTRRKVDKGGLGDRLLILAVGAGQIVLPLLFVFTPWLAFADVRLAPACQVAGGMATLAGLWLFWRSHADLGGNWSVTLEVDAEHRLVTRGVYRHMRHPMYAAFFVMTIGQGWLLANWLAGWAGVASIALLVLVRVPREEAMMIEHFGDDYRAYMRRTGGIVPRLGRA